MKVTLLDVALFLEPRGINACRCVESSSVLLPLSCHRNASAKLESKPFEFCDYDGTTAKGFVDLVTNKVVGSMLDDCVMIDEHF